MLITQDLQFGFPKRPLLQLPYSDQFHYGKFIGIIGRNGSGKSTFLRLLARLSSPLSGQLLLDDKKYSDYSPQSFAKKLSWVGTERLLYNYLTIEELVALGRHPHLGFGGQLSDADKLIVKAAMQKLGIDNLAARQVGQCSDGEKQSAMLARALAQDTPVMLLDEITAHLDFVHRHRSFKLLQALAKEEQKLVMLATHEIDLALRYCDELLVLHEGIFHRIVPEQLTDNGLLDHIFEGFLSNK
jgi:iron complex transport system ATP-binding protein